MEGKGKALIIDHVANIIRHQGPPDKPRLWTLDRSPNAKSAPGDAIPYRVCVACFEPYERFYKECPQCGHYPEPASRSSPAAVDGDCMELAPDVLAKLREGVEAIDRHEDFYRQELIKTGLPHVAVMGNVNRRREQQEAIGELRAAMGGFGWKCQQEGMNDSQMQRAFFHRFGVDVLTAQALGTKDARALAIKINSFH
jgi:hypothetical protein